MIKAVIFDLNGVFLESAPLSSRFEKKYRVPVDQFLPALKEVMDQVRKPNAPRAFDLWKPYLDSWKLDLTEKEFYDFWFSGEKMVPELVDYAKKLKDEGLKIFILSNNFKERTIYYRTQLPGIFDDFHGVYFSWETGFVKPSIETYQNILEKNNLKAEECLYFDDSEKNIEVARSLGINSELYKGLKETSKTVESLRLDKIERK